LCDLAGDPALWSAPAIADVVIPVCEAVLADRRGDYSRFVDLLALRREQIRLPGARLRCSCTLGCLRVDKPASIPPLDNTSVFRKGNAR
jgi:hypothetical protein